MIAVFNLEEAEARAVELHEKINEHEHFLLEVEQLLDTAAVADARSGRTSKRTTDLRKQKEIAEAELPELRRRYRALCVVADEERAKLAEERRKAAIARMGELVEAEAEAMAKACNATAKVYDEWLSVRAAIEDCHRHWRDNRDLLGSLAAPHCLTYPPASFRRFAELAAIAVTSGEGFAASSPLSRWIPFRGLETPLVLGEGTDLI